MLLPFQGVEFLRLYTQGVALGWEQVAPSGRMWCGNCRRCRSPSGTHARKKRYFMGILFKGCRSAIGTYARRERYFMGILLKGCRSAIGTYYCYQMGFLWLKNWAMT
jgi:hypothetical protein